MDSPTERGPRVFFVPVSGGEAQKNLRVSLTRPIILDVPRFIGDDKAALAADQGSYFAWAAKPGLKNDKTWANMRRGDFVIFYASGLYTYVATVTTTLRDSALGDALWEWHGNEASHWELIYFLRQPIRVDIPLESLSDALQSAPYQGFLELSEARTTAIEAQYGSLTDFVSQRFLSLGSAPTNFVVLRSNDESAWDGDAVGTYHYGRTVPNYKKLHIGTAAAFDRKRNGTIYIYGYGRITDIREREDGTFEAIFDFESIEERPYTDAELGLLRSEPGYNVQHAIRPLSPQLYDLLTGAKTTGLSITVVDDSPEEIAARLSWTVERAIALLTFVRRSKSILIAGPPGTGKTFLAKTIAQALTSEPSQQGLVQFHPAYQYEDFIEGIRPVLEGSRLAYEMHRGVLLAIVTRAVAHPDARYILILDELNRGNVARIFGELIYSIEYRGKENALTLASGEMFYMPDNLLIIATMNTADRSITGLDTALRRRFRQWYLGPDYDALEAYLAKTGNAVLAATARKRLERLNDELLGIHGDTGKLVGHTYFMQAGLTLASLDEIWTEQLEPLLAEYLFDRPDEVDRLKAIFNE